MANFIKNIEYGAVLELGALVTYQPGQVVSRTLAQNDAFGMTLFAIPSGEGISAHKSTGDAFVEILEGSARVTIDDKEYTLTKGECIVMPAGHPHALTAVESFKFLLVVAFK